MKSIHLIVLMVFTISFNSYACLNGETKLLKNGTYIYEDDDDFFPDGHRFYVDNYPNLLSELRSLYQKTKDLDYLSDVGYVLTIQKKYQEALGIYFEIEKKQPNRYSTASNLGTIYELLGNNKKALEWISKAVRINPKSHSNSEWLHVKILEAKINGEQNINSEFLINASFGNDTIPKSHLNKKERLKLIKALYYQLNERVSFIQPKDKIIALLLFELGNLTYLNKDYFTAEQCYESAVAYGNTNPLIPARIKLTNDEIYYREVRQKNATSKKLYQVEKNNNYLKIIIGALFIAVLGLTIILFRKRKRK
ncbi:MAG: tetratricopeptide repeat protein [Flavobacterium sp.]|uniref:tetratricopeptide repeat protein n=1 Tax=Flavobacterium sp. TaxID=239 RepID=UPI00326354E7